ncbi:MAG: hypothetical protein LUH04_10270 [Clostridium sp.]|nr:hypothetical protein [Clostridium sp.]
MTPLVRPADLGNGTAANPAEGPGAADGVDKDALIAEIVRRVVEQLK